MLRNLLKLIKELISHEYWTLIQINVIFYSSKIKSKLPRSQQTTKDDYDETEEEEKTAKLCICVNTWKLF